MCLVYFSCRLYAGCDVSCFLFDLYAGVLELFGLFATTLLVCFGVLDLFTLMYSWFGWFVVLPANSFALGLLLLFTVWFVV